MKLKTNKSAKKRIVSVSKSGILMRNKMSAQHLTTGKSKRAKNNTDRKTAIHPADLKKMKQMVPNL